jgi:hypothetical protein
VWYLYRKIMAKVRPYLEEKKKRNGRQEKKKK